jgi:hypothetical protein
MSSLLYKDAVQLNENIEILLGLPSKIKTGVQTEINHVVICTYGSGQEIINNDSDTIIIEDEQGRDVSDYYWWARPGKYTITVATFAICPAMGPEKAPTEIIATSSPQFPVSNLKSYDFDFLKAQLETNGPSSLTRKDITFDFRSSPFNAGLTNLRLTENNTVSSFSAAPKLEAGSSPLSIKSVYLGANAAPQGLSRLGTPNAIIGLTSNSQLDASAAPSSLKAWDDATDDPRAVEVFNLSFLDQPDALPTGVELINLKLRVGPESLTTTSQLQVGPESLVTTVSPVVGPTELSAYYKLFGYNAPTSIETKTRPAALTNLSYLVDMDGDGYYSDVDVDDNDDTRWDPPLIPTKIYIFPEVKSGSGWSAQSGGAGTHLNSLYNKYNFTHFKSTGTLCESGLFAGGVSCTRVYNTKSPWAPTIPGTYHLGGVYDLATSDTDPYPYYVRSLMLNLTDGSYVADTNVNKPKIEIVNGPSGADNWKMSWDNRPESDFNFGGLINYAYINNDSWFMSKNGSTSNADLGDRDLSNLVNGTFHYDTGLIRNYHAYRIAYAYKI